MSPNMIVALQALSTILSAVGNASLAAQKIAEAINKARAEGRDVSTEELKAIQAETDAMEADVLARLRSSETLLPPQ